MELSEDLKSELVLIIENTLDFCGNVSDSVSQFLEDYNLRYTKEIKQIIFETTINYKEN